MSAPRLITVGAGVYATPDDRYIVRAGLGWYRGTWVLYDRRRDEATSHNSKREAVEALAALLAAQEGPR